MRKRKDKRELRLRGEKTGGPNKAPKPTPRTVAVNPALGAPYKGGPQPKDPYADFAKGQYDL